MVIFDWDDTLQKNLNPKSSIGMFLKTLFYPCNKELVRRVFESETSRIITTRSKLYTWAIKIKCFLITGKFAALSDFKVDTISPYFFYRPTFKKEGEDLQDYLERISYLKISHAMIQDVYVGRSPGLYHYIDFDIDRKDRKGEISYEIRRETQ